MSMGIGWPNASAQITPVVMGYFELVSICDNTAWPSDLTSQLIDTNLYNVGDYVEYVSETNHRTGILLGNIVFSPGEAGVINISGPAYIGCPVYYNILTDCNGGTYKKGACSNAFESGTYPVGQGLPVYVYSPEAETRVELGEEEVSCNLIPIPIEGPAYNSCPGSLVKFNISSFCDQVEHDSGCSNLVDSSIYNTGDYVFCDDLGIRVLLGTIVPDGDVCQMTYNISGPVYNSCTEGLVRYQIIQGCGQWLQFGAATQLVNSNLYTYGDYVYSPSLDTRVTLGSITESFLVEYQIQGPAFSGCE